MKRLVTFFLLWSLCFGNHPQKVEGPNNPCADPILAYARKHGIKAIPIKDLIHYYRTAKKCSKAGGEEVIQQIRINEYERDFRRSKTMASWTSTYAVCVGMVMFYYFLGLFTASKPDNT